MGKSRTYRTSQLSDILGVSRDALRYYEEQGIVNPKQNEANRYRQYGFYDIYALLAADFYKKRNLSMKEVKKLQEGSEIDELSAMLDQKARELEEMIQLKEAMLRKINDTRRFCAEVQQHLNQYTIRALPTYEILGEISDFDAFREYPVILEQLDSMREDVLSKIMRMYTFDETGFLDTKMYIVDKLSKDADREPADNDGRYLAYPKCIYTVVEDGRYPNQQGDVKHRMFECTLQWAKERGLTFKGVAYANTRLITYHDHLERVFLEIFIPVEES